MKSKPSALMPTVLAPFCPLSPLATFPTKGIGKAPNKTTQQSAPNILVWSGTQPRH